MNRDTELPDRFTIDQGPLAEALRELLQASSAGQWVECQQALNGRVVTFQATGLPPAAWSTGEQLLWNFGLSLAWSTPVNLGEFFSHFRHSPELTEYISAVLLAGMGVRVERAHL